MEKDIVSQIISPGVPKGKYHNVAFILALGHSIITRHSTVKSVLHHLKMNIQI